MKRLSYFAYYSYQIVKILFFGCFGLIVFLHAFIDLEINRVLTAIFCLLMGVYLGYTTAYYSFKYLKEHPYIKKGDIDPRIMN